MPTTALIILAFQIALGALDNVLHHEVTERLPSRPSARRELALHGTREVIYGILFLVFAWCEPTGLFAAAVATLLLIEVVVTIADFIEEDRSRHLPPFERLLHTVLAVSYGAFLAFALPWLAGMAAQPTSLAFVSHGLLSWYLTAASVGVLAFAVRNAFAVRALARHRAPREAAHPSGRTVLVTGATGFIGTALVERLLARGDRVIVLTRDARQSRALFDGDVLHIEDLRALPAETRIDAIVNLAGAPIVGLPWIRARRAQIWHSRVNLTERLVAWTNALEHRPTVLVSASAIGFYGDRGDDALNEKDGAGRGFGADLCKAWEEATAPAAANGTRVVNLRIGLVLDKSGGPLPMMAMPARFGLGATLGAGCQWMSWITRDDLVRMIVTAIDDTRWRGPINAVAPEPLRHTDFQRAIARTLRRPLLLKVPSFALKMILGEMSSIFLASQRILPANAVELGFSFDVCWAADAFALQLGPPPAPLPDVLRKDAAVEHTATVTAIGREHDDDHGPRSRPVPVRAQGARGAGRKRA